jgi:murein DD-endopeptidase MepM/ murein hydrolase activator NlpD
MFRKNRRLLGLLCALFIGTTLLIPAYASNTDSLQSEKRALDRQIQRKEAQLRETEKERKAIFEQLRGITNTIDKTEKELENIQSKKAQTEQAIAKTEEELEEAQERLEERIDILGTRLKEIYKRGKVSYLEVLLEATSFRDFLVRYHLLEKIAEQDMELVEAIEAERQAIADKQAKLEADRERLVALEKEHQDKLSVLEEQKSEKKKIMVALETEKAAIEKGLAELEQASRAIAAKIRAAQSGSSGYKGTPSGRFIMPVSGPITSQYGMRRHPVLGTNRMHTGIDIGASQGTPIKAGDAGVVIHAGWLGAYGNAVVIDHGGGLSTLYGHMSSIGVSEGQQVSTGQVIGKVGSTGWSTGPHLHFEVRVNGEHTSPWSYL